MSRASAVPAVVILILAVPVYGFMLWNARALPAPETTDKGMASLFALVSLVVLWVLLAAMLLLGGARGRMPGWMAIACCLLVPLTGGAAYECLAVISDAAATPPNWALAVLAALPVALAAYAFWAHFPSLHRGLPAIPVSTALLTIVIALAAAPGALPAAPPAPVAPVASPATLEAPVPAAAGSAGFAARLAELTPDTPLASYLPYLGAGGDLKRQALERARLLTNRQADAEALLLQGPAALRGLEDLWRLDLAPTPVLCQRFGDQLRDEAERDRGKDGFWVVSDSLEIHLETMNWLVASQCDITGALRAVAETAASYPESPERERLLVAMASLLSPVAFPIPGSAAVGPAACVGATDTTSEQRIAACSAIIRTGRAGLGRLSNALVSRGNAYYAIGSYDSAVADYSAAIGVAPGDARVLGNRANAFDALGLREAAQRDYDEAIRLDPSVAMGFNNRGASSEARGEHDRAIADFDQALRLDPAYATALRNRGQAEFFLGKYADSARDFAQARALRPADAYALLWRILAQHLATPVPLADLKADAAALDHAEWPWPLVSVYLGEHDIPWAQEAALSRDARTQMKHACDTAFYFGEKSLQDGSLSAARVLLQQATSVCSARTIEATAAHAELARMGK